MKGLMIFLAGIFTGSIVGFVTFALCSVSSKESMESEEEINFNNIT